MSSWKQLPVSGGLAGSFHPGGQLSHVAPVGAVLLLLSKDHALRCTYPWALGAFHVLREQEELKSKDSAPVSSRDNLTAAGCSLESQSLPRTAARALCPSSVPEVWAVSFPAPHPLQECRSQPLETLGGRGDRLRLTLQMP